MEISLTERLTYSTVLIKCKYKNGDTGSGTGFIVNMCIDKVNKKCIPVIVTNNHVVEDSISTEFEFCKANEKNMPIDTDVHTFTNNGAINWIHHPDPDVDLCCLPIGQIINNLEINKAHIFYIPLELDLVVKHDVVDILSASEDLIMIGYPIGLMDQFNHKPIIRRGITATHLKNDYQGKKEFLVDMACFPGSSGSPIFIFNNGLVYQGKGQYSLGSRIALAGILCRGPQYTAKGNIVFANLPNMPITATNIPINLGIAIKAERLFEFESILKSL